MVKWLRLYEFLEDDGGFVKLVYCCFGDVEKFVIYVKNLEDEVCFLLF